MEDPKQDKILDRVQKLLAIADHPNTPEAEAEVALAQANKLIQKHAIDEALLRMSQTTEQRRAPEKRHISLASGDGMGIALAALRSILDEMANTYRCSIAVDGYRNVDLYGASEDVAWVEMLYMSTYYQMLAKINPKWDEAKSYDENVYNLKVAGFKWEEIDAKARQHGGPDARVWEKNYSYALHDGSLSSYWQEQVDKGEARVVGQEGERYDLEVATNKIKGSVIAAYKRWAKQIGDDQLVATSSHYGYRLYFIEGFKHRMYERLWAYQREMESEMDTIPGAALALVDMADEAKRMMYGDHPELDPEEQERRRRAEAEEYAAKLEAMTPSERAAFLEAEERQARKDRKPRKVRYLSYDESAVSRGRSAADGVNMNRSAGRTEAGSSRGALGQ